MHGAGGPSPKGQGQHQVGTACNLLPATCWAIQEQQQRSRPNSLQCTVSFPGCLTCCSQPSQPPTTAYSSTATLITTETEQVHASRHTPQHAHPLTYATGTKRHSAIASTSGNHAHCRTHLQHSFTVHGDSRHPQSDPWALKRLPLMKAAAVASPLPWTNQVNNNACQYHRTPGSTARQLQDRSTAHA